MRYLTLTKGHWILAAMLMLLHLSLWWDFGSYQSRSLLLAHFGLFLLWQPLWRRDKHLDLRSAGLFVIFFAGFVVSMNWLLMFCWLTLLIGLVAGQTLTNVNKRNAYMLTYIFLVSELLIRCVTNLFQIQLKPQLVSDLFQYGLLVIPIGLVFIRAGLPLSTHKQPVDFLRAITVALLSAMLAFGSLFLTFQSGIHYPAALLQSVLVLALFLFTLSWLLSPNLGYTGLIQLWERSLLNIGTPFEQWLAELSQLSERENTPYEFIEAATKKLTELPWIVGVQWRSPQSVGSYGVNTPYKLELNHAKLTIRIYSRHSIGPTLLMHCNLLVELLGHFYVAKQREQELAQRAHLQAIYETGARITHDIKNLLQSLQVITSTLNIDETEAGIPEHASNTQRSIELLRRQLPLITQRLQLALDKLQTPEQEQHSMMPVEDWWRSIQERNAANKIQFETYIKSNRLIPTDLYDSVTGNFLENALHKAQLDSSLIITAALTAREDAISVTVCDNGSKIPEHISRSLFSQPIDSPTGHGIGLYQAKRQAQALGCSIRLKVNDPGRVCFELKKP